MIRQHGKQEARVERNSHPKRRDGISEGTDATRKDRTFVRVLRKRFWLLTVQAKPSRSIRNRGVRNRGWLVSFDQSLDQSDEKFACSYLWFLVIRFMTLPETEHITSLLSLTISGQSVQSRNRTHFSNTWLSQVSKGKEIKLEAKIVLKKKRQVKTAKTFPSRDITWCL